MFWLPIISGNILFKISIETIIIYLWKHVLKINVQTLVKCILKKGI